MEEYRIKLEEMLKEYLSEKRRQHVIRVSNKAIQLCKIYGFNNEFTIKAMIAGYLHDIAKEFSLETLNELVENKYEEIREEDRCNAVLHGFAASEYILKNKEKFEFLNKYIDEELLDSLRYHTIGRENMTKLDKIVYLADAIEDKRDYKGVENIREIALTNLDKAILLELDLKIQNLIERKLSIHVNTLKFRNKLILKGSYE